MSRKYNTDPGYVTIPEADEIVLRMLRFKNPNEKSHYNKILAGAKKGLFGGKKYGARMYQVQINAIKEYANECLKEIDIMGIQTDLNFDIIEKSNELPMIDNSTAIKIEYYLKILKHYEIISDDMLKTSKKNLIMRLNMQKIAIG